MADTKITGLTSLAASGLASGDLIPIVDISETKTKSITVGELAFGASYSPTLVNVTNLDASSVNLLNYIRVGIRVHVFGSIQVDPTAASSTMTEVGIPLPIASALSSNFQCAGFGMREGGSSIDVGIVNGDATNDRARLRFFASSAAAQNWYITFTYLIV